MTHLPRHALHIQGQLEQKRHSYTTFILGLLVKRVYNMRLRLQGCFNDMHGQKM